MENCKLLLRSSFKFSLFLRLLKVLTKFVQSKVLILEMLNFTLGIWHHSPDRGGKSVLFDAWTSYSSGIGMFLSPVRGTV